MKNDCIVQTSTTQQNMAIILSHYSEVGLVIESMSQLGRLAIEGFKDILVQNGKSLPSMEESINILRSISTNPSNRGMMNRSLNLTGLSNFSVSKKNKPFQSRESVNMTENLKSREVYEDMKRDILSRGIDESKIPTFDRYIENQSYKLNSTNQNDNDNVESLSDANSRRANEMNSQKSEMEKLIKVK